VALSPEAASSEASLLNALHFDWTECVKQKNELDRSWNRLKEVDENEGSRQGPWKAYCKSLNEEQRLLGAIRTLLKLYGVDLPFESAQTLLVTFNQIVLWKTTLGDIMFGGCHLLNIEEDSSTGATVTEFKLSSDWSHAEVDRLNSIPFDTKTLLTFSSMDTFRKFCSTSEEDPAQASTHLANKKY
jgi:hypothetical protein